MATSATSYNTLNMYFSTDDGDLRLSLKYCKEPTDPAMTADKIGTLMDSMIASSLFTKGLRTKIGAEITEYEATKLF